MSEGQSDPKYKVVAVNELLSHEPQFIGTPLSKIDADAWAEQEARKYPHIKHEVAPVEPEKPTLSPQIQSLMIDSPQTF